MEPDPLCEVKPVFDWRRKGPRRKKGKDKDVAWLVVKIHGF